MDRSARVDLAVGGFPQQWLDRRDQIADPLPLLRDAAVAAGGSRPEPLHDRGDGSGEKNDRIDQRAKLPHVLGAAADEERAAAWSGQERANAMLSPDPILPVCRS